MSPKRTAALVSACGGAGATRLAVETAATLAREGRDVAVFDVAFATQGLADHVPGDGPDLTAVLAGDADLEAALVDLELDVPGRAVACPSRAPFERLARAQTAGAASALGGVLDRAAERFDHVLVDVPPVATNQAVAAVADIERVGVVAPDSERGANALVRVRDRLADVGAEVDLVVANRTDGADALGRADVAVPESEATAVDAVPATVDPDERFSPAVATLAAALFETELDRTVEDEGLLERFS